MMDWMKVEKGTPDKPEIRQIARICGVDKHQAFSCWFRLWCWFDGVTEDGYLKFLTHADCDDASGLPGMGQALEIVEWVFFDGSGGAFIKNWDRHNGKNAKKRATDGVRKTLGRVEP